MALNNLTNSRFGPLDGVRGIAVLIVFLSHASRDMAIHPKLNFNGIGHVGVYLFFCLSAYLLASKLFEEGINKNSVKRFYIKRFLRIAPLYFLVITFLFIWQTFGHHYSERFLNIKPGLIPYLQHLIFYRGDSVFWSVVAEEQFYVLVPLWIFLFIRFRMRAVILFGAIGFVNFLLYTSATMKWPVDHHWIRFITTNDRTVGNYIDVFLFAIIFLYFFNQYKTFFESNAKQTARVANFLFAALLLTTFMLASRNFLGFEFVYYNFRFFSLIYTLIFSLFVISVVNGNPVNRLLSMMWLRYIGIYGFSIYLLHVFVLEALNPLNIAPPIKFVLAVVGIFLLSATTYNLIEKPGIIFSHKLITRWKLSKTIISKENGKTN